MNQQIALKDLVISERNVRVVASDKKDDKELIASIKAHGLIQNLIVILSEDKKYEVIAGGRRLAALQYLAKQGDITEDYEVTCRIEDISNATSVSLSENMKATMHPADHFMAYKNLESEGKSIKEIATAFGQSQKDVKKLLKLSSVAPMIIKEFRESKIDLDSVIAFTVTSDHEKQISVYKGLGSHYNTHTIRSRLLPSSMTNDDEEVKLIGLKAYKAAGGAVSDDLFKEVTHIMDETLVKKLVAEKLNGEVQLLLDKGWAWVETSTEGMYRHNYRNSHQLQGVLTDVPQELTDGMDKAQDEHKKLNDREDFDDWTDEDTALEEKLENDIESFENKIETYRQFTIDQMKVSGVVVTYNQQGELVLLLGYVRDEDEVAAGLREPPKNETSDIDSNIKPVAKESNALKTDLANYRTQALQAEVMKNNDLSFDLLIFTLASQLLKGNHWDSTISISGKHADLNATKDIEETVSARAIQVFKDSLNLDWLKFEDAEQRLAAFVILPRAEKKKIMSYCVGTTLTSSVQNAVGAHATSTVDFKLEEHWQPTADNYFKRVNIDTLLEIGSSVTTDEFKTKYASEKKKNIAATLEEMEEIKGWIPKSLVA